MPPLPSRHAERLTNFIFVSELKICLHLISLTTAVVCGGSSSTLPTVSALPQGLSVASMRRAWKQVESALDPTEQWD